jgi:hypothetical protein
MGTVSRWGDYSDMTVDPVDDCTFWYTQEYYSTNSQFNWRTRIGNFTFPTCGSPPPPPPHLLLLLRRLRLLLRLRPHHRHRSSATCRGSSA